MKLGKIFNRIRRFFILKLDGINSVKYMKKYNIFLKKSGMDIKGNVKYIHSTVYFDGIDYSKIHLGNGCVISRNVTFLIHDFSIETGLNAIGKGNDKNAARFIKDIVVEDNVFIGANCIILPGAIIRKNSIIGAGTVVKGEIPENSIVVSNGTRIIGKTTEWAEKKLEEGEITYGNII